MLMALSQRCFVQAFVLVILATIMVELAHCYGFADPILPEEENSAKVGSLAAADESAAGLYDPLTLPLYEAAPAKRSRSRRTRPRGKDSATLAEALNQLDSLKAGEIVKILQRIAQRKGISLANKTLRYGISR